MFFSSGLSSLSLTYESQAAPLCFTHHATKELPISRLSMGKAGAPRARPNTTPFGLIELISWWIPSWLQALFSKLYFPVFPPSPGPAVQRSVQWHLPAVASVLLQAKPGTLCDKASQRPWKWHLPHFNDSKPRLTWGSLCGWQSHSFLLGCWNASKSSEIKILGIAAWVKTLRSQH